MIYLAICYRWGNTNSHWYFLYCGDDETKALAMAENERDGRGGKYGVAVWRVTLNGEDLELHEHFKSSSDETEPFLNWRIEQIERLGHLLLDYYNGEALLPGPDDGKLVRTEVTDALPQAICEAVRYHQREAKKMQEIQEKARADARERANRIWCPVCDSSPVYRVEYSQTFWRVARDEGSGEIEVHGLEGHWCRRCENLSIPPEHIIANESKVYIARLKAEREQLEG